tara:strand:- start:155 stop:496 length:342 start_codon:yes stop_codon:yes gene_type:complete
MSLFYVLGAFFAKIASLAGLLSFLFGFFSKSFLTVLIGVVVAAFLDSVIIMILKGGTGNFGFSFFMALGASCLVGFVTFFLRSKNRKRKAQKKEHEKIKAYGESINQETRDKK